MIGAQEVGSDARVQIDDLTIPLIINYPINYQTFIRRPWPCRFELLIFQKHDISENNTGLLIAELYELRKPWEQKVDKKRSKKAKKWKFVKKLRQFILSSLNKYFIIN